MKTSVNITDNRVTDPADIKPGDWFFAKQNSIAPHNKKLFLRTFTNIVMVDEPYLDWLLAAKSDNFSYIGFSEMEKVNSVQITVS